MKTKKIELDVDVIGGQDPLTVEEEKAISEFIKQRKIQRIRPSLKDLKRLIVPM